MAEKIEHPSETIDAKTFRRGQVASMAVIHLTGGMQAQMVGEQGNLWSIRPLSSETGIGVLKPFPRRVVDQFADLAGLKVIGGDQTSDRDSPLPTRFWTPFYGPRRPFGPADEWGSIATAAERSGDDSIAEVARKISVTLNAANIRIRDASDCYHSQLLSAVLEKKEAGNRFRNVPLMDLNLAFHSLLAEMAGARDYIAEFAGRHLGAPASVDALNRFEQWASAASRTDKAADPLAAALLGSRISGSPNAWLGELTDYRNMFLHRTPLAAMPGADGLVVGERQVQNLAVRIIEMPIPDLAAPDTSCDALTKFVMLHEKLLGLAALAADQAAYSTEPPSFEVK